LLHGSAAVAGEGTIGAGWNRVYNRELSAVPFNHHAEHRHHIPRPRYRVTNRPEYDAALRRRGSLTVWFTDAFGCVVRPALPLHDHRHGCKSGDRPHSRGGVSTKIHALVDALGNPLAFLLTPGPAHDRDRADALLPQWPPIC
jgi:hypothetical protein